MKNALTGAVPPAAIYDRITGTSFFRRPNFMSDVSTMSRPPRPTHRFRRVAILFAGGPAPAANAVISTAATAFLRNDIEVVGVLHGYSHLVEYSHDKPLVERRDNVMVNHTLLGRRMAS